MEQLQPHQRHYTLETIDDQISHLRKKIDDHGLSFKNDEWAVSVRNDLEEAYRVRQVLAKQQQSIIDLAVHNYSLPPIEAIEKRIMGLEETMAKMNDAETRSQYSKSIREHRNILDKLKSEQC